MEESFDINLAEPIHYVLQGEGTNINKKMILVRLFGCNVQCKNCDSKLTWYNIIPRTLSDLTDEIRALGDRYGIKHLMITGGNPELQLDQVEKLIKIFADWKIDLEIPGLQPWTIADSFVASNVQFNVSPKIGALADYSSHFGQIENYHFFSMPNLASLNYIVKVVSSKNTFNNDEAIIGNLIHMYNIPKEKIYIMPMGTTRDEIMENTHFLIEKCFDLQYNFTPRMHILIYDNKKLV